MSYPHVSDGDDPLFDFDFFDNGATSLQLDPLSTHLAIRSSAVDGERYPSIEQTFTARATSTIAECGAFTSTSTSITSHPELERMKDSQHLLCITEAGSQPMDILPRSTTPMTITMDGHIPGTTHISTDRKSVV